MPYYWETPEYQALKKDLKNARLAAAILQTGCKTLEEFCTKFDTVQVLRLPNFGDGSLNKVRALAQRRGITLSTPLSESDKALRAVFEAGWNARDAHLEGYGTPELNEQWIEREWQKFRQGSA